MPNYLVSEDWSHIFDDRRGDEYVRFVFDTDAKEIVAMDFRKSGNRPWSPADRLQIGDVKESITDNYATDPADFGSGAMDDPKQFGICLVQEVPEWAAARVPGPSSPRI